MGHFLKNESGHWICPLNRKSIVCQVSYLAILVCVICTQLIIVSWFYITDKIIFKIILITFLYPWMFSKFYKVFSYWRVKSGFTISVTHQMKDWCSKQSSAACYHVRTVAITTTSVKPCRTPCEIRSCLTQYRLNPLSAWSSIESTLSIDHNGWVTPAFSSVPHILNLVLYIAIKYMYMRTSPNHDRQLFVVWYTTYEALFRHWLPPEY